MKYSTKLNEMLSQIEKNCSKNKHLFKSGGAEKVGFTFLLAQHPGILAFPQVDLPSVGLFDTPALEVCIGLHKLGALVHEQGAPNVIECLKETRVGK